MPQLNILRSKFQVVVDGDCAQVVRLPPATERIDVVRRDVLNALVTEGECRGRIRQKILFKGVREFHLPATSNGLVIKEASNDEIRKLCTLRQPPLFEKDVKVFTVQGAGFVGYVAALITLCHEDDGEYNEPSSFAAR